MLLLDAAQEVKDFLGTAHGEGGDNHVAAPAQGAVDDLGQLGGVAPHLLMVPVAIGGLHHHIVRLLEQDGVADDGLVDVADIAGEDDGLVTSKVMLAEPSRWPASLKVTVTPSHSSKGTP